MGGVGRIKRKKHTEHQHVSLSVSWLGCRVTSHLTLLLLLCHSFLYKTNYIVDLRAKNNPFLSYDAFDRHFVLVTRKVTNVSVSTAMLPL